jgi:hypothetical protein
MKRTSLVLAALLLTFASSARADAILTVDPLGQIRTLGQQAVVDIESSGGYVGDFDLTISWDPSIVSLAVIAYGSQLGGGSPNSIQNAPTIGAANVNLSEISLLTPAALTALQPGPAATLFTLVFNTLAVGTSPVNIALIALGDEFGIAHDLVTLQPGSITVVQDNGQVIPEPGTAVLLLTGALFASRFRRSRKC